MGFPLQSPVWTGLQTDFHTRVQYPSKGWEGETESVLLEAEAGLFQPHYEGSTEKNSCF